MDSRHDPSPFRISEEVILELRKMAPDPDFTVPDAAGAVEGWRAWGVRFNAERDFPRLYSVTYQQYFWAPRQRAQAECLRGVTVGSGKLLCKGVEPPRDGCSCGFYSAKTLEHLQSMRYHTYDADSNGMFHIVGRVLNWGKVVEGSQGWRSQYAYPAELFVPYEAWRLVEPLARLYGVPVHLKDTLESTTPQEED